MSDNTHKENKIKKRGWGGERERLKHGQSTVLEMNMVKLCRTDISMDKILC